LTAVNPTEVDVKNAGGEFYDQEVVVDNEQLVTSRTPDDLPAFNREALRLLGAGITPPV
ncbi:DJ-1/PfpI family protein, partial [Klebsiella pneumoniae]